MEKLRLDNTRLFPVRAEYRKLERPINDAEFQWLQVTAKVFHANVLGVDVTELSEYATGSLPSVESARQSRLHSKAFG